jgi:rod shape-determining protein MreD
MKTFLSALIIFLAVILQITILPKLTIWGVIPNLVLLLVICQSGIKGYKEGLVWAFYGGLLLDFFSPVNFGIWTASFLFISFIVSFVTKRILGKIDLFSIAVISIISILIFDVTFLSVLKINILSFELIFNFIRFTLPIYFAHIIFKEIIYNTILVIIIYLLLVRFNQWLKWYESKVKLPERIK